MPHIFISYRREDSGGYAGRIYDALVTAFGKPAVFIDIDAIEAGQDFPVVLRQTLAQCDAVLALIGREWLRIADAQGRRRLDDPNDFVRQEILYALEHQIRIIPVLVGGSTMPAERDLPAPLQPLAFRNAHEVPDRFFHESIRQLIHTLESPAGHSGGWKWISRRKFLVPAIATTAFGGAAVLAFIHQSGSADPPTQKGGESGAPKLEFQQNSSAPPVIVKTPEEVAALPEVVNGPFPVSGRIAGNAAGPRHPKPAWFTRVTIGDSWRLLGFAPDGTAYVYDDEHETLSGIVRGQEQWAFRPTYGFSVQGIAPDGRVWLAGRGAQDQIFCFNSKGEGGVVRGTTKVPPKLIADTRPDSNHKCDGGKLSPLRGNWSVELDGNCSWSIEDAHGRIYVGTDRGTISYYSPQGTLLSTYSAGSETSMPLLAAGDLILEGKSGLLSFREGQLRWKSPMPGRPRLADGTGSIYTYFPEGMPHDLAAVDQTGKTMWRFETGSDTFEPIGLDPQGRLYVAGGSGLVCLSDIP